MICESDDIECGRRCAVRLPFPGRDDDGGKGDVMMMAESLLIEVFSNDSEARGEGSIRWYRG